MDHSVYMTVWRGGRFSYHCCWLRASWISPEDITTHTHSHFKGNSLLALFLISKAETDLLEKEGITKNERSC